VLTGATVVDGTGRPPIPDAVVVVRNGRIACVGARGACPTAADAELIRDTMDLAGRWIIPGLVDAHVHFGQTGWVDGRPDALDLRQRGFPYERTVADLERRPERFFQAYTCSGVTGVFDVGGYPWSWSLRERAERDLTAPHVAAAGPLLSTVDHYINLPDTKQILLITSDSAARAAVRAHVARGTDAIKVWYIRRANADTAAQQAIINAAGDEAQRANVRLIVHATSLAAAKEALRAGAQLLVHSVEDRPVDDEFLQLARANNAIYTPTITVRDGYRQVNLRRFEPHYPTHCVDSATMAHARATDTIAGQTRTPEQLRQINEANERRMQLMRENLLAVHRAGVTVVMGTDAGNPLTLPGPSVYWEMEEMQRAGLSPMEVLVASTRNGARAMGRERDFGTLEPGKQADLVVLGADPTADIRNVREVRLVMRGGAMSTPQLLAPR
jgi:imidazolonepropionase-like amidohydrolase